MIRTKQCKYNIECKCNNVIEYSYTLPTQNSWVIFPLTQPQVAKQPQIKLLVTSEHSTFWTFVLSGFQMVWSCDQADHLNTGHFRPEKSNFLSGDSTTGQVWTIWIQDLSGIQIVTVLLSWHFALKHCFSKITEFKNRSRTPLTSTTWTTKTWPRWTRPCPTSSGPSARRSRQGSGRRRWWTA